MAGDGESVLARAGARKVISLSRLDLVAHGEKSVEVFVSLRRGEHPREPDSVDEQEMQRRKDHALRDVFPSERRRKKVDRGCEDKKPSKERVRRARSGSFSKPSGDCLPAGLLTLVEYLQISTDTLYVDVEREDRPEHAG